MKIRNDSGISLALAVWLVSDDYDYINEPNYVSATSLMKPLRQIVLPRRIKADVQPPDVEDFISRALGTALHDSIEKAWVKNHARALKILGYPDSLIKRVKINPEKVEPNDIPIYLEQRAFRDINGWRVGGKYDMIAEGIVQDNKSTTAYSWVFGGKDDDHALQGSLYRWLNPDKITEDFIRINFIFTDWQKMQAKTNPNYPQKRVESKDIPLLSIEETERWVVNKLHLIETHMHTPESELPECTDEELWRSAPVYKYYSDPTKTNGRSTKNFDNLLEANKFKIEKGSKGVVITVPGEAKRCLYCDAAPICTQRLRYFPE